MQEIVRAAAELAVKHSCELLCEPGRALVAEAESVIVRVDARRGNALYVNDGAFGTLFDAAYSGFRFPARLVATSRRKQKPLAEFALYGPTCDSSDYLPGPFVLPECVREGDYIEIGQIGAYGRVLANHFNGYGEYDEVILTDEPMLSMYSSTEEPSVATKTKAGRTLPSRPSSDLSETGAGVAPASDVSSWGNAPRSARPLRDTRRCRMRP
jgi:ornithine decarboxylase